MRLFIGVPVALPADIVAQLRVAAAVEGLRATPEEQWHVTLRFFGEVESAQPILAAVAPVWPSAPIAGKLCGLGAFPNAARARVLWAGIDSPGLADLASALADATADIGEPPPGHFQPHLTLGRFRRPADVLSAVHDGADIACDVNMERADLYRSTLGPAGARHDIVASFPFGGRD